MEVVDLRGKPPMFEYIEVCRYFYIANESLPKDRKESHKRFAFIFTSEGDTIVLNIREINSVQHAPLHKTSDRNLITFEFDLKENFTSGRLICGIAGTLKDAEQNEVTFKPIKPKGNNDRFNKDEFVKKCRGWLRHYSILNPDADFGNFNYT